MKRVSQATFTTGYGKQCDRKPEGIPVAVGHPSMCGLVFSHVLASLADIFVYEPSAFSAIFRQCLRGHDSGAELVAGAQAG